MAQSNRESMKRTLLLAYMLVCVGLIGAILVSGLSGEEDSGQPSFYRATASSSAVSSAVQTQAAGLDTGGGSGNHTGGGGGGGGEEHPTPTPTLEPANQATVEAIPTIED